MSRTLVHVINNEILRQKRNIRAVGMDLDGNLTDIHKPEIYSLLWKSALSFLPIGMRRRLERYSFHEMMENADLGMGWFLDMHLGYLVLTNNNGKILAVKKGNKLVERQKILKVYGNDTIDISQPLNPDHDKQRFLPYCDGYDFVEGVVKSVIAKMGGSPTIRTIHQLDDALYLAHHSENGFKKDLMTNPEEYGIKPNKQLKDFLGRLRGIYTTFLLTNSSKDYTERILEALDITDCFDVVIPDAKKPACFSTERSENKDLWEQLIATGVSSPEEVFYMGDHLYKDVILARQFGFLTGLRMKRDDIIKVERKLEKYTNMQFETDGNITKLKTNANEEHSLNLNHFLFQLYSHVHVLTTKVQNLEPILLY